MRHAPDGRIDRVVALPMQLPTSYSFGGPDLRTLYVTSAIRACPPTPSAVQPEAGNLVALDIGVAGLPATRFAG